MIGTPEELWETHRSAYRVACSDAAMVEINLSTIAGALLSIAQSLAEINDRQYVAHENCDGLADIAGSLRDLAEQGEKRQDK